MINATSDDLEQMLSGNREPSGDETLSTVKEMRGGESFKSTTTLKDNYENKIKVPGGFSIAEDSGISIEEGIVIEDEDNNQFVWIPVGTYITSKRTINK